MRHLWRSAAPIVRCTAPINPGAPSEMTSSGQPSPRSPSPVKNPSQASPDSDDAPRGRGVVAPPAAQPRLGGGFGVVLKVRPIQEQVAHLPLIETARAPGVE